MSLTKATYSMIEGAPVNIVDFGASPSATASENDAAILAAVTYAKTLTNPKLVIPQGTFSINATAVFDLPNYSSIECIGAFSSNANGCAVQIGSASVNRFGYRVAGMKVTRTSVDTSAGSIGVQLRNTALALIDIRAVSNFQTGVHLFADQPNGGVSYCETHFGFIHNNKTNLFLEADGAAGGYVNQNSFFGGSFNHSTSYPAVATVNLEIGYDGVYSNNNNSFYSPSFEDNSALAVAAVINGGNNLIVHPRVERTVDQATYEIQFTVNSSECQIIGNGFYTLPTNIDDLGSGNCYTTRAGTVYRAQAPDAAGGAVFAAQSNTASAAKVFVARDTSAVDRGWIRGDGRMYSSLHGYFENGIRYSSSDGTAEDRGLFAGTGSPEGVITAAVGSLYVNKSGGASTTLYVKTSGTGNTGWTAK